MLQLKLSPEIEQFRSEFRTWLKGNRPPATRDDTSLKTFQTVGRDWQRKLGEGRWLGVHWPKEFGGRGLTLVHEAVAQEELVGANAPQILGLFGLTMVGPVLIA